MMREQELEACRADPDCKDVPETAPLNPETYEWIRRVDRDIDLFGR